MAPRRSIKALFPEDVFLPGFTAAYALVIPGVAQWGSLFSFPAYGTKYFACYGDRIWFDVLSTKFSCTNGTLLFT